MPTIRGELETETFSYEIELDVTTINPTNTPNFVFGFRRLLENITMQMLTPLGNYLTGVTGGTKAYVARDTAEYTHGDSLYTLRWSLTVNSAEDLTKLLGEVSAHMSNHALRVATQVVPMPVRVG